MLETWLTRTFDLDLPVIGAPMAGPGEGTLAAAVSAAGGLGMVGVNASRSADWVREQAAVAAAPGAAYGVGLMAWVLQQDPAQLEAVLDVRPSLVSVSFGEVDPFVARLQGRGHHRGGAGGHPRRGGPCRARRGRPGRGAWRRGRRARP